MLRLGGGSRRALAVCCDDRHGAGVDELACWAKEMKGEAGRPCVAEETPMRALILNVGQRSRCDGVDARLDS
jgi:hypothetical protein